MGILPLVESPSDEFKGQEYLGLYPTYQYVHVNQMGRCIGRRTGPGKVRVLIKEVRGEY